jgi:hypothetical protein
MYSCLLVGLHGWLSSVSILMPLFGLPAEATAKQAAAAMGRHPRFAGISSVTLKRTSEWIGVVLVVLFLAVFYAVKDYLRLFGAGVFWHEPWKAFVAAANCAACAGVLMLRRQIWRELRGAAEAAPGCGA